MRHLMLAAVSLSFSAFTWTIACAKKERSFSQDYIPALVSEDAVPAISRLPSNPSGGAVPGKLSEMDPEESARRKARNEIQAVSFGYSAGGITMQSRRSEAKAILAAPLGAQQGVEFYSEHIRIVWSNGGDDPKPSLLIVDEGYPGPLMLPAPYEQLKIGQSLASQLSSREDLLNFMRLLGAQFERMDSKTYQCDQALTCRLVEGGGSYELQFRKGGVLISADQLKLQLLYFVPTQTFYPRLTGTIVYGQSVGGVTFESTRASFEAKYGPPESAEDGVLYYDQNSFGIGWGPNNTPLYFAVLRSLQSTMDFGPSIGLRRVGDSFASYLTNVDDQQFMLQLDRHFEARAADFDCSAQEVPLCSLQKVDNFLVIKLTRGTFLFTADSQKKFLLYEVMKE